MHLLPNLPYKYSDLEPYIDEQTMIIHHTKHHQAYIDKLNAALQGYPNLQNIAVEDLVSNIESIPQEIRIIVRNHGGGHANHSFFWPIMGPEGSFPENETGRAIASTFGSLDKFKEKFKAAALGHFGSGWGWLVASNGRLEIITTANQDSPLMQGKKPVLGIDVWEHAYYLKYQNRRSDYIDAWFNVLNWDKINEHFLKATAP